MESTDPRGLHLLGKLPATQCPQFLHRVVDGVCGRAQPRFQDYGSVWNLREWLEVLEDFSAFFKTSVGKDEPFEEVASHLNGLSAEHQDAILKCLKSRKPEISEALMEKVCAMSSAYLRDFDWQLKLALSSDKLSSLQMPLVNLDLDITERATVTPVSVEMNKEELQNLINALEAANKVVLQLK
ncbi:COMM domain-containing protein 8 [Spea bombifrons]|uniref:COMM domain-containing protein 8 n=1 Tax=Spea bombifrons TaxID=233779 RepID=UPI002349CDA1|nr:COMM domain-containing protein 8 [Spea bombifrons]